MNFFKKMELSVVGLVLMLAVATAKRTTTKTKLDIRVVRSPQHGSGVEPQLYVHQPVDVHSGYVLTSQNQQARKAEEIAAPHHVSLISEAQYEALLKQAQKALQGYDLTKLSAMAHQALHTTPAPALKVEHKIVKPVVYKPVVSYKPAVKYVYTDAATSISYNTPPVSASYTHTAQTDEHEIEQEYDHYSKHKFGYRVSDPHTGAAFGHSEVSEGHVTRGHYHVLLPDGRLQNVRYVADPSGYHATVTYDNYKHH